MNPNKIIKIFVSYHKDCYTLSDTVITPVQVGASMNSISLDMHKDNEGENISSKNDKYCELTAQYWAWKNVEADYYGFMHYRRHFVFKEIPENPDDGGLLHFEKIDESYMEKIGLDDKHIYQAVGDADIVLPTEIDLSGWCAPSNEIQFSCLKNLHAIDFINVCDTVTKLYPEYAE